MNQRLVESVAQIVLSMTEEERRLLGRKLRYAGLKQIDAPTEMDKSLRIAEIAQDIQDFEENYCAPLSALPAEQWTLPAAEPTREALPTIDDLTTNVAPQNVETQATQGDEQSGEFQSFMPTERSPQADSNGNGTSTDYALYRFS